MPRTKNPHPEPTLFLDRKGVYHIRRTCPIKRFTKSKTTGVKDKAKAEGLRRAFAVELHSPPPPTDDYTVGAILRSWGLSSVEPEQYANQRDGGKEPA